MKSSLLQHFGQAAKGSETDPARAGTPKRINQTIDERLAQCVRDYARRSPDQISQRIGELKREWDAERVLETNASTLALTGLLLGVTVHRRWLALPGVVMSFLLQHVIQGWCPPLPVIRALGVRTRREIDREMMALKVLRGDFDAACGITDPAARAEAALKAVQDRGAQA